MSSSNIHFVFPLQSLVPLAVTPKAATPPTSLCCLSEGRQQVFCDSKIREPQKDGAPLSSAACVGGGEQIYDSIFGVSPLSAIGESTYSHPRTTRAPVQYTNVCVLCMLHAYACLRLQVEFFYQEMSERLAALLRCHWGERQRGCTHAWTNMANEEEARREGGRHSQRNEALLEVQSGRHTDLSA